MYILMFPEVILNGFPTLTLNLRRSFSINVLNIINSITVFDALRHEYVNSGRTVPNEKSPYAVFLH